MNHGTSMTSRDRHTAEVKEPSMIVQPNPIVTAIARGATPRGSVGSPRGAGGAAGMRAREDRRRRQIRVAGLAAMLGGLLWVAYGVFEMLQPWGADTVYRDELQYEVVTDVLLYRLYSLPGGLALLFTTLGLLGVFRLLELPVGRIGRTGRVLAYVALALALLSVAGVVISFDPLFTGPRIFGTVSLGAAAALAGVEARRTGIAAGWSDSLMALGLLGLFLLPLWPLVHAIELVPEAVGAGIIALFGLGWMLLGFRLWFRARAAAQPDANVMHKVRVTAS